MPYRRGIVQRLGGIRRRYRTKAMTRRYRRRSVGSSGYTPRAYGRRRRTSAYRRTTGIRSGGTIGITDDLGVRYAVTRGKYRTLERYGALMIKAQQKGIPLDKKVYRGYMKTFVLNALKTGFLTKLELEKKSKLIVDLTKAGADFVQNVNESKNEPLGPQHHAKRQRQEAKMETSVQNEGEAMAATAVSDETGIPASTIDHGEHELARMFHF